MNFVKLCSTLSQLLCRPTVYLGKWLDLGAAGASKKGKLTVTAGSSYVLKKETVNPNGDEADFICPEKSMISMPDGVGSWVQSGEDPAHSEYAAWGLIVSCAKEVRKQEAGRLDLMWVPGTRRGDPGVHCGRGANQGSG